MHPDISSWPGRTFYDGQLQDALRVQRLGFGKQFLPPSMPYHYQVRGLSSPISHINLADH